MSLRSRLAAAVAAFRTPSETPARPEAELVGKPAPRTGAGRRQQSHTPRAPGLTPGRIAAMLKEADEGRPERFAQLMLEIEDRDLHLVSVMGTRKRAVANLAWSIQPTGDSQRELDVAESIERWIGDIDGLEDGFLDLLHAILTGWAAVEVAWEMQGDLVVPRGLEPRLASWFRPDPSDPMSWRLLDENHEPDGMVLPPYRFIVHTPRAKSGFPVQSGLGRAVTWWWLFKNYAIKDWVSYAEKFGAPLRVGTVPSGASTEDMDALDVALAQLGVDAHAVVPEGMKVEFVSDSGSRSGGDTFERLLVFANREISKGVLGQTLTTEESARGTQALGLVHNDVRQDLVVSDAKQLSRTLRDQLLRPLVGWNFGWDTPVPRFLFDTEPPADERADAERQEVRARVFASARALGIDVPVAQVHEELGIREADAGEAVLPPPPAPMAPPVAPMRGAATEAVSARAEAPHGPGHACPSCGGRHGALAARDRASLPAIQEQLDAVLARQGEALGTAWAELVDRMERALAAVGVDGAMVDALATVADGPELETYAQALAEGELQAELVGEAQAAAGDIAVELPDGDTVSQAGSWAALLGIALEALAARREQAEERARDAARWSTLSAADKADKARQEAAAQPDDGPTGPSRSARVQDATAAAMQSERANSRRTTGTLNAAGSTAYSRGRARQMDREADRKPYFRYRARMVNTRPHHAAMNGKVYPADHAIWNVWRPPNGWNCFCWIEAYTAGEVEQQGWEVEQALPINLVNGQPMTPDPGWARDMTRQPHEQDWSGFPVDWRLAVGAPAEDGGA